ALAAPVKTMCAPERRPGPRTKAFSRSRAQFPEHVLHVADEQVRLLHGGKVAAPLHLGPVDDVVVTLGPPPGRPGDLSREDGAARRRLDPLARRPKPPGPRRLVVHAGR